MGIEKLTSSLLKEADDEAAKIVAAAESHVKEMKAKERTKMAGMEKQAEQEVEKVLKDQKNERLAWARLEAKRITAEAREDAINNAIEDIFDSLRDIRKSKEYKDFMLRSIPVAVKELEADKLTLHVLKDDKKLLPKLPKSCKVATDLDALGGAMIETQDGKMRADLTLETLFELRRDELRKKISAELFGGKK